MFVARAPDRRYGLAGKSSSPLPWGFHNARWLVIRQRSRRAALTPGEETTLPGERRRPQGGVAFRETREQLFARFLHSEPEKHRHVRSRYDRPQRLVGAEPNGKAFGRGAPSRINMRAPEITLKPCPGMIAFIRFRRMAAAHPPSVHCGEAQNAGLRRNETHAGPHYRVWRFERGDGPWRMWRRYTGGTRRDWAGISWL